MLVIVSSEDVVVVLHSFSMTAEFMMSLGLLVLLLLLTRVKIACADKLAAYISPFVKNLASKMQLIYLVA